MNRYFSFLLVVVFFVSVPCSAPSLVSGQESGFDASAIQYDVDLTDAKNHYVSVMVTIPVEGKTTEVMMAVWTPGSYLVREYARHLDSIEATSVNGEKLSFEKTKKNRWVIETDGSKSVQFKYRVYCNEMSVRTNWVGKQYAMLNGAPTFVTLPDRLNEQHVVRLKMPNGWTRSATSLKQVGDTPHTFLAEGFDEIVDSPIVAGNINVYPFTIGGVDHQLVNIGESGYWDGTKAAADLKRVVAAHQKMWGNVPYDRYLFLNMINESGGGLEHDNSTLIMTSRWSFRDQRSYTNWLSLASHEFFHTWNVRRLRPKSLVKYDYENEVYTKGLWVAEGVTSYYEDLLLARAGLISRKEFLAALSKSVSSVQGANGRKVQSLKESSFDTWIKFYRPDENSSNTRISYYSKGAVAAFLLDAKIRKLTKGKKSLDDVMRQMYASFSESGYTSEDFRKTASDVAGKDLSDWFVSAIDSTDELDYSDLEAIGVVVPNKKEVADSAKEKSSRRKKKKDDGDTAEESNDSKGGNNADSKSQKEQAPKAAPKAAPAKPAKQKPWLGISTRDSSGRLTISAVKPNSPATEVGLNTDDEVIAINGFRVRSFDRQLSQYEVGDQIEVLIARRGKLMTMEMTIGTKESENWNLKLISKPSKAQEKQLDLWLGVEGK
ncbi:MAG: M61 family metallopeptidase [Mariniblastus sp.]